MLADVADHFIELDDGARAVIDVADRDVVAGFNWKLGDNGYVMAWRGQMNVYLHRLIAGAGPQQRVDHENGDPLDCRTSNLRFASAAQNRANAGPNRKRGRTSRFKGVSIKTRNGIHNRWVAHIHIDGSTRYLGAFETEVEAADAYDRAAECAWGEFARLNNATAERGSVVAGEATAP